MHRDNLFRGILFCDCCGHPLTLSRKKLKDREVDIYLCSHHNLRPDECPRTHIIYHEVLYPYVLEQLCGLAKSMRKRKINSPICQYRDIQELTQAILKEVVDRIMIGHVSSKTKPARAIEIRWKLSWRESFTIIDIAVDVLASKNDFIIVQLFMWKESAETDIRNYSWIRANTYRRILISNMEIPGKQTVRIGRFSVWIIHVRCDNCFIASWILSVWIELNI